LTKELYLETTEKDISNSLDYLDFNRWITKHLKEPEIA